MLALGDQVGEPVAGEQDAVTRTSEAAASMSPCSATVPLTLRSTTLRHGWYGTSSSASEPSSTRSLHVGVVAGHAGQVRRRGTRSRASRPGGRARTARRRWRPRSAWWPCRCAPGRGARRAATCSWARRTPARSSGDRVRLRVGQRHGRDDVRRGGGGDLAGRRTPDAVGDEHAGRADEAGVLVAGAHQADVAHARHRRTAARRPPPHWSNVLPTLSRFPRRVPRAVGRGRGDPQQWAHGMAAARDLGGPGARVRGLRSGRVRLRRGRPGRGREGGRRGRPAGPGRARGAADACPPSSPAPRSA